VVASPKVLIVEDDAQTQEILQKVVSRDLALRHLGLEAVAAADGEEGLARFREHHPVLVVTDLLMPKMDGFKLIEAIRRDATHGKVPILAISGVYRDKHTQARLERDYGVQLHPKPFSPRSLAKVIYALLHPPASPAAAPSAKEAAAPAAGPGARSSTRAPRTDLVKAVFGTGEEPKPQAEARGPSAHPAPAAEPAAGPRAAGPPKGGAVAPSMQGSLVDKPLPLLLIEIHEAERTGTLDLRRGKIRKLVYLMKGYPIFVQSNQRSETLGQMLVRRGGLTAAQHAQALALTQAKGIKYGEALVQLGYMTEGQVMAELLVQTRVKIEACLRWRSGSYVFAEDTEAVTRVPRCVLDPVEVIFEGLKRYPNLEEAFSRVASKGNCAIQVFPRFEKHRERFARIGGRTLVDALVSGCPVGQVIQKVGSPQDAVLALDVLLQAGMVDLVPLADTPKTALPEPSAAPLALEQLADVRPHEPRRPAASRSMPLEENSAVIRISPEQRATLQVQKKPVDPERLRVALQLIQATHLGLQDADHYKVLGVMPHSEPASIEVAYRIKRKQFDPSSFRDLELGDKLEHLREICRALDEAFAVLSDEDRRVEYEAQVGGQPEESAQTTPRARALQAEDLCQQGEEFQVRGQYVEAAAAFEKATALDDQSEYRSRHAYARFLAAGESAQAAEEAMVDIQTALAINPGDSTAHLVAAKVSCAIGHTKEAMQHLQELIKLDPSCREGFDEMENIHLEEGTLEALETEYRRTIHLLGNQDSAWCGELWQRLALLYRDKLHDGERARLACAAALRLVPDDRSLRSLLADLDRANPARWPEAVLGYRSLIEHNPEETEPLHELFRLHLAAGRRDAALVAARAAQARSVASAEEKQYVADHRPAGFKQISRPLDEVLFEKLRHPDDDPDLGSLLDLLSPLLQRLHPLRLGDFDVTEDDLEAEEAHAEAFARALTYVSRSLGVDRPRVVSRPRPDTEVQALGTDPPLLLVGQGLLATADPAVLCFRLGRAVSLLLPGHRVVACRARHILRSYILAALVSSAPQLTVPDPDGLVAHVRLELSRMPELQSRVQEVMASLQQRFQRLNLSEWQRGIQRTAERAGLLLCADLGVAHGILAPESKEAAAGLLSFALSEAYGELRAELGLALA
jgi:CheY-like chemotaxis protein